MIQNEKTRIWVNRVIAFLVGALLIYAVISLSVVKNVNRIRDEWEKQK